MDWIDKLWDKAVAAELAELAKLKPGEPCSHPGCLSHVTHPCEGCGRVAGQVTHDTADVTHNVK